jgi:hypothetical protein
METTTNPAPTREDHPAHDLPTAYCPDTICSGWTLAHAAADVTDEMLDLAETYADTDVDDRGRIDWEAVFDRRLEGAHLSDNRRLTLGGEYDTPAQRKIQREIRKRFR